MNIGLCREIFTNFSEKTLLAGFSGGSDSCALLLISAEFCREYNIRLVAVSFNHHLRGAESDAEIIFAKNFCKERNIEFTAVDLDIPTDGSIEENARNARLAQWQILVKRYNAAGVLLGHHLDDCLENFFIRIGRGANTSGATSLRQISTVDGVTFIRPLVSFAKSEILDFLKANNVSGFAVDSSNLDNSFRRNDLRNNLLPEFYRLFPGGKNAVKTALLAMTADALYMENEAQKALSDGNPETASFWRGIPTALLPRVMRYWLREKLHKDIILSSDTIDRLCKMLNQNSGGSSEIPLGQGVDFFVAGKFAGIVEASGKPLLWHWEKESEITFGQYRFSAGYVNTLEETDCACAYFDAAKLNKELLIAPCNEGERMIPFGNSSPVKIKKLRTDRKIPAKLQFPVVKDADTVIWAPMVRHSNYAAVDGETTLIVRFAVCKK